MSVEDVCSHQRVGHDVFSNNREMGNPDNFDMPMEPDEAPAQQEMKARIMVRRSISGNDVTR